MTLKDLLENVKIENYVIEAWDMDAPDCCLGRRTLGEASGNEVKSIETWTRTTGETVVQINVLRQYDGINMEELLDGEIAK